MKPIKWSYFAVVFSIIWIALAAVPAGHTPAASAAYGSRDFDDVPPSHPYYRFISYLKHPQWIDGYAARTFEPSAPISRAEFTALFVRSLMPEHEWLNTDSVPDTAFADVPDWARTYVWSASLSGLIEGTSAGLFSPHDKVTREQAAAIAWRYLRMHDVRPYAGQLTVPIADASPYAQEAVRNIVAYGLHGPREATTAKGYRPGDQMTRAEAAALVYRVYQKQQDPVTDPLHAYLVTPDGIRLESYSPSWGGAKLKEMYEELRQNKIGREWEVLERVVMAGEDDELLGLFIPGTAYPEFGPTPETIAEGSTIYLFGAERYRTPADYAETLSHEYGHLFSFYWTLREQGISPTSRLTKWAELRGFRSNSRVLFDDSPLFGNYDDGGHHTWAAHEIMADDYVLLFGSPTARRSLLSGLRSNESFSDGETPENSSVPSPEGSGLREYWSKLAGFELPTGTIRPPEITSVYRESGSSGGLPVYRVLYRPATDDSTRKPFYFVRWGYDNGYRFAGSSTESGASLTFGGTVDQVPVYSAHVRVYAYFPDTGQLIASAPKWYAFDGLGSPSQLSSDPFAADRQVVTESLELRRLQHRLNGIAIPTEEDGYTLYYTPTGDLRATGKLQAKLDIEWSGKYKLFTYGGKMYMRSYLYDAKVRGQELNPALRSHASYWMFGESPIYHEVTMTDTRLTFTPMDYIGGQFVRKQQQ